MGKRRPCRVLYSGEIWTLQYARAVPTSGANCMGTREYTVQPTKHDDLKELQKVAKAG